MSGTGAVVRTWSDDDTHDSIIAAEGPLLLSMGTSTWSFDREPSSRAGAVRMLREVLASPDDHGERVTRFVNGDLDGIVICDAPEDIFAISFMMDDRDEMPALMFSGNPFDILAGRHRPGGARSSIGPYTATDHAASD